METTENKELDGLSMLQKNISELARVLSGGTAENLASLQSTYETLHVMEEEIRRCLPIIETERARTNLAILVLKGDITMDAIADSQPNTSAKEVVVCGHATVEDIEGCTQRQAMYVIAKKNDGFLSLNKAVDLVVAAKLNKGTRKSCLSTLHHYLSTNNDFTWVAPSEFRLKLNDDNPELTTAEELALSERLNGNAAKGLTNLDARQRVRSVSQREAANAEVMR